MAFGSDEVRALEIRSGEVRPRHVGAAQHAKLEISVGQVGLSEVCFVEKRAPQVGFPKDRASKIGMR
ncbi:MAG: hypothetical protein AMXMBFR4_11310 [Candidatus Hydrogenedentota bacterium]